MSISEKYNPKSFEDKWYKYWLDNKIFKSTPDKRKPYTIVIPPPNVTGVLHMGHMLNNTIQDILIRRARMRGYNACWVPGTDHASIATEAKVVEKLKNDGISKNSLTRDQFLEYAWKWTDEYGGVILDQLKKIGCSCDWDRTKFTLDPLMSKSVVKVFIELFKKGYIYRGYRMVNWDPKAQTTVSDEEVIYREQKGKLFFISYMIDGEKNEKITVATTRPETILGDTAICINPKDKRYKHLKGKEVIVPIVNRVVPIIMDEYVDPDFGTGCLKVTPSHDPNDKIIGEKYSLDFIDIFSSNGTLNQNGLHFKGKDRFEVRKLIINEIKLIGQLVKIEDYINNVGTSERTNAIIEPRISEQWFLSMKELVKPAINSVLKTNEINLIPKKFNNTYRYWVENITDWNISRQLWWGHRIPVYYYGENKDDFVVAESFKKAVELAKVKTNNPNLKDSEIRQDEDVLDTWFSSWLWPISVFDGINNPDNDEINYYYPTQDLVTGPDILFFWVARMIISGYEFRGKNPFSNVYLTGLVRDQRGRKMSKQLGNSPDALNLIQTYGADGVRVGLMLSSAAGNDLLFNENLCNQGKNFANKIWNAFRLIDSWKLDVELKQSPASKDALEIFNNKFNKTIEIIDRYFKNYRISEALMTAYKLTWDDFCSWLLETLKPSYGSGIDKKSYDEVKSLLEKLLKIIHPFMPFITEELWHRNIKRKSHDSIGLSEWPKYQGHDDLVINKYEKMKQIISGVRNFRKDNKLKSKQPLNLFSLDSINIPYPQIISKLTYLDKIKHSKKQKFNQSNLFTVDVDRYYIPFKIDVNSKIDSKKYNEQLVHLENFLISIEKKLSNANFINSAPKNIIDLEKKKLKDTKDKIEILKNK
tara:strand:+ start:2516 stop:5134 length:2619 start_codon:yes stop_codon:yes gene_type:complete